MKINGRPLSEIYPIIYAGVDLTPTSAQFEDADKIRKDYVDYYKKHEEEDLQDLAEKIPSTLELWARYYEATTCYNNPEDNDHFHCYHQPANPEDEIDENDIYPLSFEDYMEGCWA